MTRDLTSASEIRRLDAHVMKEGNDVGTDEQAVDSLGASTGLLCTSWRRWSAKSFTRNVAVRSSDSPLGRKMKTRPVAGGRHSRARQVQFEGKSEEGAHCSGFP